MERKEVRGRRREALVGAYLLIGITRLLSNGITRSGDLNMSGTGDRRRSS